MVDRCGARGLPLPAAMLHRRTTGQETTRITFEYWRSCQWNGDFGRPAPRRRRGRRRRRRPNVSRCRDAIHRAIDLRTGEHAGAGPPTRRRSGTGPSGPAVLGSPRRDRRTAAEEVRRQVKGPSAAAAAAPRPAAGTGDAPASRAAATAAAPSRARRRPRRARGPR